MTPSEEELQAAIRLCFPETSSSRGGPDIPTLDVNDMYLGLADDGKYRCSFNAKYLLVSSRKLTFEPLEIIMYNKKCFFIDLLNISHIRISF